MEPLEAVYDILVVAVPDDVVSTEGVVDPVPEVVESVGVGVVVDTVPEVVESVDVGVVVVVDAVPVEVEVVDVVVDAFAVIVEPTAVVVDPDTALSVVESFFLFRVKPTLNPIVSATTAKPNTPSKTNRLRRVYFELDLGAYCTKNEWIIRKDQGENICIR